MARNSFLKIIVHIKANKEITPVISSGKVTFQARAPPFNSKADYNELFKEISEEQSTAQIQAFSDFWHWDTEASARIKHD
jgi:hypothetical protein